MTNLRTPCGYGAVGLKPELTGREVEEGGKGAGALKCKSGVSGVGSSALVVGRANLWPQALPHRTSIGATGQVLWQIPAGMASACVDCDLEVILF